MTAVQGARQLSASCRLLVVMSVVTSGACNQAPTAPDATNSPSSPPAGSQPASTQSPAPPFTLSGVVYESTADGLRPLAGIPLDVSVEYQQWPPKVTSDSQGRYSVSGLQPDKLKVAAEKEGYSQPCRANVDLKRDSVLDVFVVSNTLLARTGIPSSYPVIEPTLTGLVFERTAGGGTKPVSGVRVGIDFTGGWGWAPSAITVSDAEGRFLMCNVTDVGLGIIAIWAYKPPTLRSDFLELLMPFPTSIDIEVRIR